MEQPNCPCDCCKEGCGSVQVMYLGELCRCCTRQLLQGYMDENTALQTVPVQEAPNLLPSEPNATVLQLVPRPGLQDEYLTGQEGQLLIPDRGPLHLLLPPDTPLNGPYRAPGNLLLYTTSHHLTNKRPREEDVVPAFQKRRSSEETSTSSSAFLPTPSTLSDSFQTMEYTSRTPSSESSGLQVTDLSDPFQTPEANGLTGNVNPATPHSDLDQCPVSESTSRTPSFPSIWLPATDIFSPRISLSPLYPQVSTPMQGEPDMSVLEQERREDSQFNEGDSEGSTVPVNEEGHSEGSTVPVNEEGHSEGSTVPVNQGDSEGSTVLIGEGGDSEGSAVPSSEGATQPVKHHKRKERTTKIGLTVKVERRSTRRRR